MKWQQVMPICSTWPVLSRLALVQNCGDSSVIPESIGSVCVSSTLGYWCLIGEKTYLEKTAILLLCCKMLSRGGAEGKPLCC